MNQTIDIAHPVDMHLGTAPSNLAKAITAFAFSDLSVRPCGHGLPPQLPYRQGDWTVTEISKSELSRDSIIDREILNRFKLLDESGIPYDHIYIGHQDKKPFEIPQKVIDAVRLSIPVLASILVGLASVLAAVVMFVGRILLVDLLSAVVFADPIVIVAIRESDGTYNLLECAKWYD